MLCTGCASTSGLPDGLGLFGVLSIVRLRSSQISQRALIERLELLLTAKVQHIVLDSTDLVRDLTVVDVRSRAEAAGVPRRDDEASARELPGGRQQLTGDGQAYLDCNGLPSAIIEMLLPTLTTTYDRSTLLDADGPRYTIGVGLECIGQQMRRASAGENYILETKSASAATPLDRLLWSRGHRPVSISKYCTGLAAVTPGMSANKWNRTLRNHYGWQPAGAGRAGS